ncbi:MAG TPA: metallopeptidase TldD-related protein [Polyangiaceae bacterium]|nr:metallopeptidase TldD-related protein [Polyangiaceae bacterium]
MSCAVSSCAPPHAAAADGAIASKLPAAPKELVLARPAAAGAQKAEPLLELLEGELARNAKELAKAKDRELAPYFIEYEATDEHTVEVEGSFGTLVTSTDDRSRSLDVDVRVGTPKLDNTHRLRGDYDVSRDFTRQAWLPLEDDPAAVRSVAWLTTNAEYQRALEDLVRVKANQEIKVAEQDTSDDFSAEPPSSFHETPAALSVDRAGWEARVRKLSAAFAKVPELTESRVRFEASAETRYIATSEGSSVQVARLHGRLEVTASTIADDGMRLERTETVDVPDPDQLPSDAAAGRLVERVVTDLTALRKAPLVEPYAGPAILDGRAAAVFFHEIFGHRVEGHRQKDEEEGQTFAHQVGQRVMPSFLDVYDDPAVTALNGTPLNGHYPYDDEGVAGGHALLVDHGTLRGFLLSRSPAAGFPRSNGHGRREHGHRVVSRQGNLVVDPSSTTSPAALKEQLIRQITEEGKPFGLRFHEITGGYTNTTREGSQAFKVLPVMVYRIYPDGREELVRGVDLEGTPLASLARIEAAGNDFEVFNGVCGAESGWVPVSATSPSLLLGQIEVTRQEKSHDRPPLLEPPAQASLKSTQRSAPLRIRANMQHATNNTNEK